MEKPSVTQASKENVLSWGVICVKRQTHLWKKQTKQNKTKQCIADLPTSLAHCLTHLPLDKMAAILADFILKCIFLNEKVWLLTKISLKFVLEGPIDNSPALV